MNRFTALASAILVLVACDKNGRDDKTPEPKVDGKVETYTYAPTVKPSIKYEVSVNGQKQLVYTTPEPHICLFGCDGTVKVTITSPAVQIKSVDVRPVSKKPWYKLENGEVTLYMNPKDRYDVELNGSMESPLFLFANPMSSEIEPKDGNIVRFEAGKIHDAGEIVPKDGDRIYIDGGAVVMGHILLNDSKNHSDIEVCGGGILHDYIADEQRSSAKSAVRIKMVDNLRMHDLTVLNSTAWTNLLVNCSNVTVDNIKAIGYASAVTETGNENDAFDILGGHDISIKHNFSYCHDDTYCIKSQKFAEKGEVYNVSYEDCIAWNTKSGNSFEIGYELNQNVHDISYKDIYAIHSVGPGSTPLRRGGMCIHNAAGGTVEHVRYENVYIEDPYEFGIYMMVAKSNYDIGAGVEWTPGCIKDVYAKNVYILREPKQKNYMQAVDNTTHSIDITFENLYMAGKKITNKADGKFSTYNCEPKFK